MDQMKEKTQEFYLKALSDVFNKNEYKGGQTLGQLKKLLFKEAAIDKLMTLVSVNNKKMKKEHQNSVSTIKIAFGSLIFTPLATVHVAKVLKNLEECIKANLIYYYDFCHFWLTPEYEFILTGFEEGDYPGKKFVKELKQKFQDLPPSNDFSSINGFFKNFLGTLANEAKKGGNFDMVRKNVKES